MEHEYNYADIDAYIRHANQLRSEALGQWIVAGWVACKRLCLQLVQRKAADARPAKPADTHGLVY